MMSNIRIIQESKGVNRGPVLSITIPKHLAAFKGWKKGDALVFEEKDGNVILYKK